MSEQEQDLTYFFQGPASFSSMTAQAFLHFGYSHEEAGKARWIFSVESEGVGYRAVLSHDGIPVGSGAFCRTRQDVSYFLLDQLSVVSGKPLGRWGYLLGMRPSKALYPFLERDSWKDDIRAFLREEKTRADVSSLLLEVARCQRALPRNPRTVAFYIHIPFCPSHCAYCSFPSEILQSGPVLDAYTDALCADIREAGRLLEKKGLWAESLYIGGGTPTILTPDQMDRVLSAVRNYVPAKQGMEKTVEAGRPDTIYPEMLDVLAGHGIKRISLNPQTMQNHILEKISRSHTAGDINRCMELVRKYPFQSVNMDFICGLPEMTLSDMKENLETVCQLCPENVTIHTLAIKRGSPFWGREREFSMPSESVVESMLAMANERLCGLGYHPYYLYRQKYMTDDFANVGYAKDGHDCVYNIQMIGEKQHVIGVGAGAVSKAVLPGGHRLKKLYMPRQRALYISRCGSLCKAREELFETIE